MKTVTVANPAAGADWVWTVPSSTAWQIQSIRAQLVTSAAVANRTPVLRVTDTAGNIVLDAPATAAQAASATVVYEWVAGVPDQALTGGDLQLELPTGLTLEANWTVQTVTAGIQAGDQWSLIVIADTGITQTF